MKLVVLIGGFPPGAIGGAEIQAEGWASRLAARHGVIVVTRRGRSGEPDREERDGFAVVRLPVSRVPLLRTALDVLRVERTVAAIRPRPDALLCFQTFVSGFIGVRLQRTLGVPAVVWVRGEDEYRPSRGRTRRLSIGVWREAAGVLVQSPSNREAVLAALGRFAPGARAAVAGRIEVVPNGLRLPAPPFPGGPGVVSVGRLIADKGMDTLIDAMAGVPAPLTIAGDGPERAALEARARRRGVEARFTGFVGRDALSALYGTCACVVLASRRGEGLPNVVLEAMGHARPVVATAVTGVTDLVRDGVNGLLVPPADPAALRRALERITAEPGLAGRLGAAARATAEEHDWDRVTPRLEALLERWRRR